MLVLDPWVDWSAVAKPTSGTKIIIARVLFQVSQGTNPTRSAAVGRVIAAIRCGAAYCAAKLGPVSQCAKWLGETPKIV